MEKGVKAVAFDYHHHVAVAPWEKKILSKCIGQSNNLMNMEKEEDGDGPEKARRVVLTPLSEKKPLKLLFVIEKIKELSRSSMSWQMKIRQSILVLGIQCKFRRDYDLLSYLVEFTSSSSSSSSQD